MATRASQRFACRLALYRRCSAEHQNIRTAEDLSCLDAAQGPGAFRSHHHRTTLGPLQGRSATDPFTLTAQQSAPRCASLCGPPAKWAQAIERPDSTAAFGRSAISPHRRSRNLVLDMRKVNAGGSGRGRISVLLQNRGTDLRNCPQISGGGLRGRKTVTRTQA
jgi:hypothetical protein